MISPALLSDVLETLVVVFSSTAAAKGIYEAIFGLLAKRRAQDLLHYKLASNPELERLVFSQELQGVSDAISSSLGELSPKDREFVERGLHQQGRPAERRYIENLLGAAAELREAKALVDNGNALGALGRNDEAIAAYNDVVARFGAATEPPLLEQVAKALVGKGRTLGALGRNDEALAAYDDVLARYGTSKDLLLLKQLDEAQTLKAGLHKS